VGCSEHTDLSRFAGQEVLVIGAGASAIDIAVELADEGSEATVVCRAASVRFHNGPSPQRSLWQRVRKPSSGIGPGLRSWAHRSSAHRSFAPGQLRVRYAAYQDLIIR
jgi:cation diffusion facilitator CzcD-associated flavoprotein CzcO